MSETTTPSAKVALAPFDNVATADIIFRTSDSVLFHAHKIILSIASTFFEGMFSIPQPPFCGDVQDTVNGIPIINIPEDSTTIDCVLRYCYPVRDPVVKTPQLLDRVLRATIKYALDQATFLAVAVLQTLIPTYPLHAYAISCRHELREEAKLAASMWKTLHPVCVTKASFSKSSAGKCYDESMRDLPAYHYYHLMRYMISKRGAGSMLCRRLSVLEDLPDDLIPDFPPFDGVEPDVYPFNQESADTAFISNDGKTYLVHRAFIEMQITSNAVFPLQSLLITPTPDGTDYGGKPFYLTSHDPVILSGLLRLCYPAKNGNGILQWTDEWCCSPIAVSTIGWALRYGMIPIAEAYKSRLQATMGRCPLDVYLISITLGWHAEAYSAAKYISRHIVLPYASTDWIDMISAEKYHHILRFWYDCQDAMAAALSQLFPASGSKNLQYSGVWYAHTGKPEARRESSMVQQVLVEVMGKDPTTSAPTGQISVSTRSGDQDAEMKTFIQRCVELEGKFDEAIASVDFQLC